MPLLVDTIFHYTLFIDICNKLIYNYKNSKSIYKAKGDKMIHLAVCDDDKLYIENTLKLLLVQAQKIAGVMTEIRFFTDGNRLLEEYQNHKSYDIVILDIDMPSINGKELAVKLRGLDSNLYIAFLSAYKEEVYEVIPLDIKAFIPKDYDKNKCLNELVRLLKRYKEEKPKQQLFNVIENGESVIKRLNVDNIRYIKAVKGTILINTAEGELISTERSLKAFETKLSDCGFYKVCSNILLNVNKVYQVLDTQVVLNDNTRLPISRRRRKELLVQLSRIISAKVVT